MTGGLGRGVVLLSNALNRLSIVVASGLLVIVLAITGWGIVARFLIHHSLTWGDEVATYLFIWMAFLGAAVGFRQRTHPTVTILLVRLPRRLQVAALCLSNLVVVVVSIVLLFGGVTFIALVGGESATSVPMPVGYAYLSVPVAGALLLVHAVANTVDVLDGTYTVTATPAEVVE